ncbi:DNA-entry nuclease [Paenibacillus xylanexedens]|uniref:NucA/NucB deoxyribonuclease domain-containing protein n=1 Tax=Paenibacillus xylanexedens TaxID=528191 RepID=UPI001F1AD127|nr:NucA/NucB deoxyribonuclease domain-containing protein [Paenibacillus xylanexedens]MCF7753348.1 DNA-entry nuclease [Paenibacillus xylanexedens]
MKKLIISLILALILGVAAYTGGFWDESDPKEVTTPLSNEDVAVQLVFPVERYPETAEHIQNAIESGHPSTCTIDRNGADDNRKESLRGIDTKKGYDRDEWPMAMCAEGGEGADIEYISPSDNRGAGSWVGNQLEEYPDGTLIEFIFE